MKRGVRKVQVTRRTVQIAVVAALCLIPALARYNNYLSARQLDRQIEKWEGTWPGHTLVAIDTVMQSLPEGQIDRAGSTQRNRTRILEYAQAVRGSAWSAEIGNVSMTDPLAAAESVFATRKLPRVVIMSLVVPLLLTLLLGRVFCSWICPMGFLLELNDKLRGLLRFLEIRPRNLRVARATKYGLLIAGLALTAIFSMPVLGYVYPPAIVSREIHDFVFAAFDRAEMGRFGLWAGGLSWMAGVLLAIVLVELTVSRRWWCRYVCPGGALYSLIGWARPVRVVLDDPKCTGCALCVSACPMALNPMKNQMGIECDNCGVCIGACEDDALHYGASSALIDALTRREHAEVREQP